MRRNSFLATLMAIVAILAAIRVPARADSAQDNYTAYCAKCHGREGHGDGPSAASLATKPQDYTDCAAMQKISDDTMFKCMSSEPFGQVSNRFKRGSGPSELKLW